MNSLIKLGLLSSLLVYIASAQQSLPYRCKPRDRGNKVCTLEYRPVCGWFNKNVRCLRYPCAINAGNVCSACSNKDVEYVSAGPCPQTPPVARPCTQLALCVQGYHWDPNVCSCVPDVVGYPVYQTEGKVAQSQDQKGQAITQTQDQKVGYYVGQSQDQKGQAVPQTQDQKVGYYVGQSQDQKGQAIPQTQGNVSSYVGQSQDQKGQIAPQTQDQKVGYYVGQSQDQKGQALPQTQDQKVGYYVGQSQDQKGQSVPQTQGKVSSYVGQAKEGTQQVVVESDYNNFMY
jgi:hypothetical protein